MRPDEVAPIIEGAVERLERVRAKMMDLIAQRGPDGLGEILGDLNKALSDLEQALKLLRGRGAWSGS